MIKMTSVAEELQGKKEKYYLQQKGPLLLILKRIREEAL